MSTDPLLQGLTDPQRDAVTHVDGPALVLAGPGSGKTRVITRRIAYLVRSVGIAPWNILAITFTNKAAGEMRERVASLLHEREARRTTVATFHALCARFVREFANRLDLSPGYSIYDMGDQKNAIKQALQNADVSASNFTPAAMLDAISKAKNKLITPAVFADQAGDFYSRVVAKVYKHYQDLLRRNNAMDFDDLLVSGYFLLKHHPDVRELLQNRYQYVLIDEYQDTNHPQFMLASVLGEHQNIMATGDPDQSIYGWRGADISNILDFESHYPRARVIRLEQNFRSTKKILAAADALIQNNAARKHKELFTDNDEGDAVTVVNCSDERHEAEWVVNHFRGLHEQHDLPWGAMAVFYRMNSLSRVMEDAFRTANVPYQIARGTAFYERKEIKDFIAYLRVIANPADEVNLQRIINMPTRGISQKTVSALQVFATQRSLSLFDAMKQCEGLDSINTRAQNAVARFADLLTSWRKDAGMERIELESKGDDATVTGDLLAGKADALADFVRRVLEESTLADHYARDKSDPDNERVDNLGEFISFAQQFEEQYLTELMESDNVSDNFEPTLAHKLLALLEQISLVTDIDSLDTSQGAVTLMTLHAAKGLEFPVVAIIGLEDGLLPHERSQATETGLEEERRLLFVGVTRAMQRLSLSLAAKRTIFGQTMPTIRSRFLRELPAEGLEQIDAARSGHDDDDDFDARLEADSEARKFPPGTIVRHPRFGLGRVLEIAPMGGHTRARVKFNAAGTKTLVLQYANLELASPPGGGSGGSGGSGVHDASFDYSDGQDAPF